MMINDFRMKWLDRIVVGSIVVATAIPLVTVVVVVLCAWLHIPVAPQPGNAPHPGAGAR